MLDFDIILFRPDVNSFLGSATHEYHGKPLLNDGMSSKLRETCGHWRREIEQAAEAGKTIFVFLAEKNECFVSAGEQHYSGTGRHQATTKIVEGLSNYDCLPYDLQITKAAGKRMRLTDAGERWLAPYSHEIGFSAGYKVQIAVGQSSKLAAWLMAKGVDIAVGGVLASKKSPGGIILLPDLDFEQPDFLEYQGPEAPWSDEARQFTARLLSSLVAIDKKWHAEVESSTEPDWASLPKYALQGEQRLLAKLPKAERLSEEAAAAVNSLKKELAIAGQLRALLFEKGKPLESAIIQALELMGFEAKPYKGGESEFDVVFERDGERLLGEAEGKDTKAINVDKLRQLSMNIHEDLRREEVSAPAKGVLFGNGYRFQPPAERGVQFTDKCISAALSQSTALVATSDLFTAAQYLFEPSDEAYKAQCRRALLLGTGLVTLPSPPCGPNEDAANDISDDATTKK